MRSWLTATGVAFLFLALATPAQAIPGCWEACSAYCAFGQPTSCSYPEPCVVSYTCSDGTRGTRPCSCGGGCFLAGTRITMADGTEKPIEAIQAGDMVLAYDEKDGTLKPDRVKVVHEPVTAEGYLVVNEKLHLTNVHPVLTPGGWKEIGELAVGDKLIGADKKEIAIASIRNVAGPVKVYNFATNPYETYVANGVIVHNKPPTPVDASKP
jgi:hypothetical protein